MHSGLRSVVVALEYGSWHAWFGPELPGGETIRLVELKSDVSFLLGDRAGGERDPRVVPGGDLLACR